MSKRKDWSMRIASWNLPVVAAIMVLHDHLKVDLTTSTNRTAYSRQALPSLPPAVITLTEKGHICTLIQFTAEL